MGEIRNALIDDLISRNYDQIKAIMTRASKSGRPMPEKDRSICIELRKANVWLNKAKGCISKATEGGKRR